MAAAAPCCSEHAGSPGSIQWAHVGHPQPPSVLHHTLCAWVLQELTTPLLKMRFGQPELWAAFEPYWASCPAPGELASKYMFEEAHIPLLQDAELVRAPAA